MNRRIKLAAYLAHIRRADGSWLADWTVARLAVAEARQVLRKHLTNIWLPQDLTEAAHAASEDVRTFAAVTGDWKQVKGQVLRVVPVVQRILRTLADSKKMGL
ncbi:MAG: hypothetical protein EOO63_01370 [Hymenobacter sp.]|nr:MAG: hypothetical protein EOO63_01370 [Hymenobacter sp.]